MPSRRLSCDKRISFRTAYSRISILRPGTRLEKWLARSDRGINSLNAACRDIAYSHSNDLAERHVVDNILAEKARKRITASDLTLKKRAAATAVWAAIKAKTKIGFIDLKTKKKKKKKKKKRSMKILLTVKRGSVLPFYYCWAFSDHWLAGRRESPRL